MTRYEVRRHGKMVATFGLGSQVVMFFHLISDGEMSVFDCHRHGYSINEVGEVVR